MEALGARFAASKADAIAALGPLAARAGPLSAAERSEAQAISHKLAGVSAIFGEPALGDAARHLDEALSDPDTSDTHTAELLRELVALLSAA